MDPMAFERLCQRLLRESAFIEVSATFAVQWSVAPTRV
jgi:hypothetical protein